MKRIDSVEPLRQGNQRGIRKRNGKGVDRATLSSMQLYQLVARDNGELNQDEKNRVSPDLLYLLAVNNKLGLSQHDRDRLKPLHLAHLAITNKIVLSLDDKSSLPTMLLFRLYVQGCVGVTEADVACYHAAQSVAQQELEAAYSASRGPP